MNLRALLFCLYLANKFLLTTAYLEHSEDIVGTLNNSMPSIFEFNPHENLGEQVINLKLTVTNSSNMMKDVSVNAVVLDENWDLLATVNATFTSGTKYAVACPFSLQAHISEVYRAVITGPAGVSFELKVRFIFATVPVTDKKSECDPELNCVPQLLHCRAIPGCLAALDECGLFPSPNCLAKHPDIAELTYYDECVAFCKDKPGVYDQYASNRHIYISYFDVTQDDVDQNTMEVSISSRNRSEENFGYLLVGNTASGCPHEHDLFRDSLMANRLTWSHTGTLHFSLSSTPPISVGRWYIGVWTETDGRSYDLKVSRGFYTDQGIHYFGSVGIPWFVSALFLISSYIVHRDRSTSRSWHWKLKGVLSDWLLEGGNSGIPMSYSWYTFIVAMAFGISTIQVVFSTYALMAETGDHDICFYNEKCFHPSRTWHVPINNIESNGGYMIMGAAFVTQTAMYQYSYYKGQPQYGYSTFYALGWALIAEGTYSLFYHICPKIEIFQFDTANMFLIAMLLMIATYQQGEQDTNLRGTPHGGKDEYSFSFLRAPKFFLFFIIPLFVFNYIGVELDTGEKYSREVFAIFVVIWECWLFLYYYFRARKNNKLEFQKRSHSPLLGKFSCREEGFGSGFCGGWITYFLVALLVMIITIYTVVSRATQIASMFLFICVILCMLFLGRMGCCHIYPQRDYYILIFLLMTGAIVTFGTAAYYFLLDTTEKSLPPHESRLLNKDCAAGAGFEYFDYHDLWHIIGSYGLYLFMQAVFWINPPEKTLKARFTMRGLSSNIQMEDTKGMESGHTKGKKAGDDGQYLDSDNDSSTGESDESKEAEPV